MCVADSALLLQKAGNDAEEAAKKALDETEVCCEASLYCKPIGCVLLTQLCDYRKQKALGMSSTILGVVALGMLQQTSFAVEAS